MVIENIQGNEYYNYALKDVKIVDRQTVIPTETAQEKPAKDYASHIRDRKHYGKCKRFRRFLYNKDNKTSCNRTGKHWGALIFYFAFFLGILLIFFMCYFYGINRAVVHSNHLMPPLEKFHTLEVPTFTFVPIKVDLLAYPILWYLFTGSDGPYNRRMDPYVEAIKDYYKNQATMCAKQKLEECLITPGTYGPCGTEPFGYDTQEPCLMLKLNAMSGWRPDAYHSKHKVPKSMPKELYDVLDLSRETLCMYCSGTTLYDQDHIGTISYLPEPCFNESFFPFAEGPINMNPTIAIQLVNIDPGYILSLTCRLYGVNADGTGSYEQSIFVYIGQK